MPIRRKEFRRSGPGTSSAAAGLKETTTGDTLCDESHPITLERIDFYEPVTSVAIEPKSRADQEKLDFFLQKLVEEDPTFRVKFDEDTGQTVISGMGELHLEVIVRRLLEDFNVAVNVGKPQVVYRETITQTAEVEGKFEREIEGVCHFGHVRLRLEPRPRGSGVEFSRASADGTIPEEFIPSIEAGVKESTGNGVVAGYPIVDLQGRPAGRNVSRGSVHPSGVPGGRGHGFSGRVPEGPAGFTRTDHENRSGGAGRISGRGHWRPERPQRPDRADPIEGESQRRGCLCSP